MENAGSLKEYIYKSIINMVVDGSLEPGKIITEKGMIERFGYSKSPVREALIELCKDNVLRCIPRCGYQVEPVSIQQVREIVQARLILELGNFKNISSMITESEIDRVFAPMEKIRKQTDKDMWTANSNNVAFHMALIELSGNSLLISMLQRLLDMNLRAYAQSYNTSRSIVAPVNNHYHGLFLEAWKNGDFGKAEDFLRKDIESTDMILCR